MSQEKVKISSFLEERKDRFKPEEANKLGLKRISKIDFSGNIHLVEHKPTRTNMILVKNGDLLISGINAEKGAIAVYEYEEDAIATIHYSSYVYDNSKIKIDYLKCFLKSNSFKELLISQVGSSIKSELKPKKFLPLEIDLPSLSKQREILNKINSVNSEIEELQSLVSVGEKLVSLLRQVILQEAIQGKLTIEWRKQNPNVEHASKLLEHIGAEKETLIEEKKLKKEKPLPSISEEDIPFEIPESWVWCRFGDYIKCERGKFSARPRNDPQYYMGNYPFIQIGDLPNHGGEISNHIQTLNEKGLLVSKLFPKGTITIAIVGSSIGKTGILGYEMCFPDSLVGIKPKEYFNTLYVEIFLRQRKDKFRDESYSGGGQPNIKLSTLNEVVFPLPPKEEQEVVSQKVEQLLVKCDKLEEEIKTNRELSNNLVQSILNEILGEENDFIFTQQTNKKRKKTPSRVIKYDSKTTLMELIELLEKHGKLHAEDMWRMSKYPNDIDAFYTDLKKQIEERETIKEVKNEKGFLELA